METILFTGGSSLLAQSWIKQGQSEFNYILGLRKRQIGLSKLKSIVIKYSSVDKIKQSIAKSKADIVINCIGLTNVEDCENNFQEAKKINIEISKRIASACFKINVKFVQISTDHLFDGKKPFYSESAFCKPLNNYGITKAKCEKAVIGINPEALIIRTNFFGIGPSYKASFSDKILNNLVASKVSNLFSDVFYTPVSVNTLRKVIIDLLKKKAKGIFNVSSNERLTKYQFGVLLAETYGYSTNLLKPISIDQVPNLSKRPKDMSLCNHKLCSYLESYIPSLKDQISELKLQELSYKKRNIIPYGRQDISEIDIKQVVSVLRSDFVTQGPIIQKFEKRVAEYCKVKFSHACNSATSALHIACLSLGVAEGDIVWTSPISFVASSNCALYCNAKVDFVDIDSQTYNMSVEALEKKLITAKKNKKLPKVVIPVHLSGQTCEMDKIYELSREYGFKIIEDASHSIGASYKSEPVGNCKYSDITVFSFHPVKIITTCEGGMCLTNDPKISTLLGRYRSHGITRHAAEMSKPPDGAWYYEQINLGLNYRMNDVQASLGLSQMDRLDDFVHKRRIIAKRYDNLLENTIVDIPKQHKDSDSSFHLYIIRLKKNKFITHKQLFDQFRSAGILVNIHYIPIYRQPYYKSLGFSKNGFDQAERYYKEAISIPIFPTLTIEEQDKVVSIIKEPMGFQNLF